MEVQFFIRFNSIPHPNSSVTFNEATKITGPWRRSPGSKLIENSIKTRNYESVFYGPYIRLKES